MTRAAAALTLFAVLAACVADDPPAPSSAPGELVYRQGTVTWRLKPVSCENELLRDALEADGFYGEPKAAVVHSGSRTWGACWTESVEEAVVADHRGIGMLPLEWFRR